MLTLSAQTQIYIAIGATDMRKGFDSLCGLVIEQLKKDPLCGSRICLSTNVVIA